MISQAPLEPGQHYTSHATPCLERIALGTWCELCGVKTDRDEPMPRRRPRQPAHEFNTTLSLEPARRCRSNRREPSPTAEPEQVAPAAKHKPKPTPKPKPKPKTPPKPKTKPKTGPASDLTDTSGGGTVNARSNQTDRGALTTETGS